jgi:hypothetical protein
MKPMSERFTEWKEPSMTRPRDTIRKQMLQPEQLPEQFGHELRRLDALLGRCAQQDRVPSAMAERVFNASAHLLPRRERLRLIGTDVPHRAVPMHRSIWGRLALAACVGLMIFAAARLLHTPTRLPELPGPGVVVQVEHDAPVAVAARPVALTPDEERLLLGSSFAYLFDTRDLTFAELERDVARLARDIEG